MQNIQEMGVREVIELSFESETEYADPYHEVELNVHFISADGARWAVPAFWAGENLWKVRFAAPSLGVYSYETQCSDEDNEALNGSTGQVLAVPNGHANSLQGRGRLQVTAGKRYLTQADGTPFLWLADTWWMGLCRRLPSPSGLEELIADRVNKGFNVIQLVAGLYPDMPPFDARGANEAGFPLSENYRDVNPEYFARADERIGMLIKADIIPCLVGAWGYHILRSGTENMQLFWRYLVARYAAYPIVWCIAGEATMPYYLSTQRDRDKAAQRRSWTEVTKYVRAIDPFRNPITIHPSCPGSSLDEVDDGRLIDIDMLQTGHRGYPDVRPTLEHIQRSYRREPHRPVLVGEVNYEGIMGRSWDDVQRLCFWGSILNGTAGHSYGANGLWQMDDPKEPYGPSPHGMGWGISPWQQAMRLAGSLQLGHGKRFLERLPWWELEPHPEWIQVAMQSAEYPAVFSGGSPRRWRLVYLQPEVVLSKTMPTIVGLEEDVPYVATYFNPADGSEISLGTISLDRGGSWLPPRPTVVRDWVLAMIAPGLTEGVKCRISG